jgi:hypothetical protein
MQNYCDIVPDATGWVYVIDGVQSSSYFHTSELAVEAAKVQLVRRGRFHTDVFRCLGVDGKMAPIEMLPKAGIPKASFHS